MKLFKEKNLTIPLTEELIESTESVDTEDLFMLQYIEENENSNILYDYFVLNFSQSVVAERNGKTQQRVSQIVRQFQEEMKELYDR